ncbi:uncharacterized protein LOC112661783 isoform X2 [Canis lupus dingo]|uniref:uncharacterized protein LOC112661783 isoform X2 n=1 Tax=Canis lupus dingo TaxID=286419 RepID=UPI0020C31F1C|nr:uncharacterized protein LOC112661783 isoform X2 [Canis lupus dingo]
MQLIKFALWKTPEVRKFNLLSPLFVQVLLKEREHLGTETGQVSSLPAFCMGFGSLQRVAWDAAVVLMLGVQGISTSDVELKLTTQDQESHSLLTEPAREQQ